MSNKIAFTQAHVRAFSLPEKNRKDYYYTNVVVRDPKDCEARPLAIITPKMITKKYKSFTATSTTRATRANVSMRLLWSTLKHAYSRRALGRVTITVFKNIIAKD